MWRSVFGKLTIHLISKPILPYSFEIVIRLMTRNLERVIMCQFFRAFPNDVWSNPGIKTPGLGHAIVAAEHHGVRKAKKINAKNIPDLFQG